MAKKVLGKGLMALLDDDIREEVLLHDRKETGRRVEEIPLGKIRPSGGQPRKDFSGLDDLIASVKEKGILQPLLVRKKGGHYEIIAGERRFRAAKEAKKEKVPVVVLDADDEEAMEFALIENIQRKDLNPIEEAKGYQTLIDRFGLTQEKVSEKIGRDRSTVANSLRLLSLCEQVQNDVASGKISAGHAKILAGLKTKEEQLKWRKRIIASDLSVRKLEEKIYGKKKAGDAQAKKTGKQDVFLRDFEVRMEEFFSTRVRVLGTNKKGKIMIEYYSLDDLERINSVIEKAKKR
jgi:ParB family chromosome partitioning protein